MKAFYLLHFGDTKKKDRKEKGVGEDHAKIQDKQKI
jgi:hypothetical protein